MALILVPSILEVDSAGLLHDVGLWADHADGKGYGFEPLTLVIIPKHGAQPVDLLRMDTFELYKVRMQQHRAMGSTREAQVGRPLSLSSLSRSLDAAQLLRELLVAQCIGKANFGGTNFITGTLRTCMA